MKNIIASGSLLSFITSSLLFSLTGCADLNQPYYPPQGGYYDPNPYPPGYGYDNDYRRRKHWEKEHRRDRYELDRERERLEEERRRLEAEKAAESWRNQQPPPPAPQQDRCPPGFRPSEQKCTQAERARGCKDIRTPSGLGCVNR